MANTNELDYSRKVADGERLELIMRQVASKFKLDGNVLAEALLDIHERLKAVEGATEELTSSDRWKAFKTVQLVKPSPSASGDTVTAIDTVAQDENGELTATKKSIRQGTTSQTGIVQLSDATNSTSTALAATANAVKKAYDLAASKQDALGISSSGSSDKFLNEQGEWTTVTTPDVSGKLDKDGLGDDVRVQFTQSPSRTNIVTTSKLSVLFGKIQKWFADMGTLAFKDKVGASDVDSDTYNIDISGNAATANKLGSANVGLPSMPIYLSAGTPMSIEGYFFSPPAEPSTRKLSAETTLNAVGGGKYVYNVSTSNTFNLTLASTAAAPIAFAVRIKCTANCPNVYVTYNDAVEKTTLTRLVYLTSGQMVDMCFTYYYGYFHLVSFVKNVS